jgi:endonuclease YncB( thermonuclease family)
LAAGRCARSPVRFLSALLAILAFAGAAGAPPVLAFPQQSARAAKPAVQPFTARVTAVVDGDTIRVVDDRGIEFNIRVDGIDCPESGQPFGGVALRFTRAQVFDRSVQVRIVDTDSRGRYVARVSTDGQDLSTQLLRSGLAWHYTDYSKDAVLAAAERDARQSKRGLWSEATAVPPWVWRRQPSAARPARRVDRESGPFFANTSSRVFHAASCRNAHCKNCTVTFATAQAAEAAGYRPAGDCLR